MNYKQRLSARTRQVGHTICVGFDPILHKIPGDGPVAYRIEKFYLEMLDAMDKAQVYPAAVKPNSAYFEAHGLDCLQVLRKLVAACQERGILVILDAKRGDIASTSGAYAQAAFEVFGADAVTVAPYMGWDTVKPFLDASRSQGVYVLVRTSNPSARDFQELWVSDGNLAPERLFRRVAAKLLEWNHGDIGAVIGATAPAELEEILSFWKEHEQDIPLLIPGIAVAGVSGGQGGDMREVLHAIHRAGSDWSLHLINSSSGVNYAYEKHAGMAPAEASVSALRELIQQMQTVIRDLRDD